MAETMNLPQMTPLACSCLSLDALKKYFTTQQLKAFNNVYDVQQDFSGLSNSQPFSTTEDVTLEGTSDDDYIRAFVFWLNYYSAFGLEEINLVWGAYIEKMSADNQKKYFSEYLSEKQKLYLLEHGIKFADADTTKKACESTEAYKIFKRKVYANFKGMSDPKIQKEEFSKLSSVGLKRAVLPALSEEAKPSSGFELTKGIAKLIGYGALLVGCFLSDLIISQISKPATEFLKSMAHQRISDLVAEITVGFVASGIFYIAEEKALEGLNDNEPLDNSKAIQLNNTKLENGKHNENNNVETPLLSNQPSNQITNSNTITLFKPKQKEHKKVYTESLKNSWGKVKDDDVWNKFKSFVSAMDTLNTNSGDFYSQMQDLYDKLDLTKMNKKLAVGDVAKNLQPQIAFMFEFLMSYIEQFGANNEIYNDLIGIITLMDEENQMKYIADTQLQQLDLDFSVNSSSSSLSSIDEPKDSNDTSATAEESPMPEDMLIELLNRGLVLRPNVLETVSRNSLTGWQFRNYIEMNREENGNISKASRESIVNRWENLSYGERMLTYPVLLDYGIAPTFSIHKMRAAKLAVKALALVCFCSGILTACLTPVIPIAPAITGILFSIGFSALELCNIKFFAPAAKRYEENYDMQQAYEKTSLKTKIKAIKNQDTGFNCQLKKTNVPTFKFSAGLTSVEAQRVGGANSLALETMPQLA